MKPKNLLTALFYAAFRNKMSASIGLTQRPIHSGVYTAMHPTLVVVGANPKTKCKIVREKRYLSRSKY